MKRFLLLIFCYISVLHCNAQCDPGQIEVTIEVNTDNWGYETYWELQNTGIECGTDPIFTAGNADVGCEGAGLQVAGAGGYDNNSTFIEGPFCLEVDSVYDIIFIDDWGDGGLIFEVIQEGVTTGYFVGSGAGNTFSFTAGDLNPAFIPGDRPCEAFDITVDGDTLIMDNIEATVSPGEFGAPLVGCAVYGGWCESNGGPSNTMWATFIAPESGTLEISTCNDDNTFDTALAVYEVGDCDDFSTYTLVSSNDDAYGGCGEGSTGFASVCYASCLNPGETYYIQLDGWAGASGVTELTVTTVDLDPDINGFVRDVACANIKGETGSRVVPQVVGLGVNYDIVWEGPFDFTSNEWIINNIPPGEYTCTITNDCGFSGTETFTVNQPDPVSMEISSVGTTCEGAGNGQLSAEVSGGVGPYEYVWSGPNKYFSFDPIADELEEGTYTLEITDDNGCVYTSSAVVETDNELAFSLGENQTICLNQYINFTAPEGFFQYEWQDGSDGSMYVFSGWQAGIGTTDITLTLENSEGCTYTDVVTVMVDDCVGVDEVSETSISIYPNPSSELVNIDFGALQYSLISLTDAQGRLVYRDSSTKNSVVIDVSKFSAGVYQVSVLLTDGNVMLKKLIVE